MEKLIGKNVLILDTETTGFPKRIGFNGYIDYRINSAYDSSRIVQIAWAFVEDFSKEKLQNISIDVFVRKPIDFYSIPNSDIHGINYQEAIKKGLPLSKILNNKGLSYAIQKADIIIAHNAGFDVNILLNELHRIKFTTSIKALLRIKSSGLICTGELGRNICKIPQRCEYKMPRLEELYYHFYHKDPEKGHDAYADVSTLVKIIIAMLAEKETK